MFVGRKCMQHIRGLTTLPVSAWVTLAIPDCQRNNNATPIKYLIRGIHKRTKGDYTEVKRRKIEVPKQPNILKVETTESSETTMEQNKAGQRPTKVIIDTDPGTDDALAILMALEAHRQGWLEVLALTTVQGNTTVQHANNNALRILDTAGLLGVIPVYGGCSEALVRPWQNPGEPFHGHNGFGDTDLPPLPSGATVQPQHAVEAMQYLVNNYPNEVTLVSLGPQTNIAMAIRQDPSFTNKLKAIYAMGGNTTGRGNTSLCGEFNFLCDPEAAHVVLENTHTPVHLVPWEFCLLDAFLPYEMREKFGSLASPAARLMNSIEANIMDQREFEHWITCDQLAVAWMLDDVNNRMGEEAKKTTGLVTATETFFATVELQGLYTRGQMVVDHDNRLKRKPNVIVMAGLDKDLYKRYLSMAFGGGF